MTKLKEIDTCLLYTSYMVIKSDLLKTIAEKVRDKVIEGLTDVRDESGRAGMRIVIEYRRDANGHVILNQLYKYTKLQDTCAINMLALVNGEPKVLPLKAILSEYIKFQEEVITPVSYTHLIYV